MLNEHIFVSCYLLTSFYPLSLSSSLTSFLLSLPLIRSFSLLHSSSPTRSFRSLLDSCTRSIVHSSTRSLVRQFIELCSFAPHNGGMPMEMPLALTIITNSTTHLLRFCRLYCISHRCKILNSLTRLSNAESCSRDFCKDFMVMIMDS